MGTFEESSQEGIAKFILENLPRHRQFALGTVDEAGRPWVVCIGLTYDDQLNVIWKSRTDAEHSKHILKNPNVSMCIFSRTEENGEFGFYTRAIAREISDKEELTTCLDWKYAKKGREVPPASSLLSESQYRIYLAEIKEAWVTDDRHLKIGVDLVVLRNAAKHK